MTMVTAADFLENMSLFPDTASSTVSLDGWSSSDPLDYDDNSGSNIFMGNDDTDPAMFAENDCAVPLVSGPTGRTRKRNQCSGPSSQLQTPQLPTLDDFPLENGDESVQDSLKNEEICSPLVFGTRNIPICSSGSSLDEEFILADHGYLLQHCAVFYPIGPGCFFEFSKQDLYCCSKYYVKSGISYAKSCSHMLTSRLEGNYQSLP